MMIGIELVRDRATKEPFPRTDQVTERVLAAARDAGLLLYSSTGHVDGANGDLLMLGPPFCLTRRRGRHARRAHGGRDPLGDVSGRVGLVVCPQAKIYDHGPQHPLRPERVLLTWELIEAYGLDMLPNVGRSGCEPADRSRRSSWCTRPRSSMPRRAAGHGEEGAWGRFGYGPGDNPIFDDMHEAGAIVVGATVEAARAVWSGEAEHAFNAAGGLHHAMPDRASGFCVYDDPAVAIAWLLAQGAERIAYVDVDVHHGDGVAGDLLGRPAGAHGLDPRVRPRVRLLPGHGRIGRARRARCRGIGRERAAARRGRATTPGWTRSAR